MMRVSGIAGIFHGSLGLWAHEHAHRVIIFRCFCHGLKFSLITIGNWKTRFNYSSGEIIDDAGLDRVTHLSSKKTYQFCATNDKFPYQHTVAIFAAPPPPTVRKVITIFAYLVFKYFIYLATIRKINNDASIRACHKKCIRQNNSYFCQLHKTCRVLYARYNLQFFFSFLKWEILSLSNIFYTWKSTGAFFTKILCCWHQRRNFAQYKELVLVLYFDQYCKSQFKDAR